MFEMFLDLFAIAILMLRFRLSSVQYAVASRLAKSSVIVAIVS